MGTAFASFSFAAILSVQALSGSQGEPASPSSSAKMTEDKLATADFNLASLLLGGFSPASYYILSSFASNGGNGGPGDTLKLILSSSTDGSSFTLLNTPFYSDAEGVVRDPSLTYVGGKFFVAYTCNVLVNGHGVVCLAQSSDLQTWTRSLINIPSMSYYVWAPEFFIKDPGCIAPIGFDSDGKPCGGAQKVTLQYSTGNNAGPGHRIYSIQATDNSFNSWTNAAGVANTADDTGMVTYDPTIWKNPSDGKYYIFHVTNNGSNTQVNVQYGTSTTYQGPYTNVSSGDWTGQMNQRGEGGIAIANRYEGPQVLQISSTSIRMFFDHLDSEYLGAGLCYTDSSSLNIATATWSNPVCLGNIGGENNGLLDHLRHGTVLPIRDIGAVITMSQYTNPGFKLFVDNASPVISKGGTAKVNVSELTTNRFSGIVAYSVTGLTGTGLSASFSNATTTTAGTTALTLSASGTASPGTKNINLVGTSGSITVTMHLSVQVSAN